MFREDSDESLSQASRRRTCLCAPALTCSHHPLSTSTPAARSRTLSASTGEQNRLRPVTPFCHVSCAVPWPRRQWQNAGERGAQGGPYPTRGRILAPVALGESGKLSASLFLSVIMGVKVEPTLEGVVSD